MTHIPIIERATPAEIAQYQSSRLSGLMAYLYEHSPYYRALFAQQGVDHTQIDSLDALRQIPTTDKETFHQHNMDFLCVPTSQIADYCTTSGTTGQPVTIALTAADLDRLAYNEHISFTCAGGTASDLYQLMLTLDRQFMAGIAYYQGIRRLGAGTVRVGPGSPQLQLDHILRFKPTVLVAVPSFLMRLVEYAQAQGIDLNQTSVRSAVCIGEVIRHPDFTPNLLAQTIQQQWDIKLYSTYAATEMQTAFTECEQGRGGHHHPELVIAEVLDDAGAPVPQGEYGELTITTLGVEAMPLLRYRTGDMCTYYQDTCGCGRTTMRLSPIVGRKNQLIKYKGTTLYPPAIYEAIAALADIIDYMVEVSQTDMGTDEIKLYASTRGSIDVMEAQLKAAMQSKLRVTPTIHFVTTEQIQAMRPAHQRKPIHILFKGKA
jgi:phenylacetate-CoA ligase